MELPCLLNRESTVREWLEDPRGRAVFEPMFQQMTAQMAAAFGGGEGGSETIGMDMMGFMMEMPLLGIFRFQEDQLPSRPTTWCDTLLGQVHGS